jgi:ribosomal protein S18 acetylase RimI-like enzyme
MAQYPKVVSLKDGSEIVIRSLAAGDTERLRQFFCKMPPDDRLLLRRDVTDPAVVDKIIQESGQAHIIYLMAEREGEFIGVASLTHPLFGWTRKVGDMRLIIAREFQHLGLGSILAREIFIGAVQLQLDKVTVSMAREQKNALQCVQKLGFKEDAILGNYIMDVKGMLHDRIVMSVEL